MTHSQYLTKFSRKHFQDDRHKETVAIHAMNEGNCVFHFIEKGRISGKKKSYFFTFFRQELTLTLGKSSTVLKLGFSKLSITMLKDTVKVALDDTPFDVTENDKSPDYLASWKAGIFLSFGGIPGEFEHKEALSLICAPYPCFPLSTFLLCGSSTSFSLTVSSSDEGDNFHGSQYLHGCI